jgi:UDP-N-acetylmuramate: L-alanyl-gamma-D-glutamyl-meso-diaminopimelate ligase
MYRAPNVEWEVGSSAGDNFIVHDSVESLLDALLLELSSGDVVIIMSNGGFDNLQSKLVDRLQEDFNVSLSQIQPSP